MDMLKKKTNFMKEAEKAKFKPNAVVQCLLFLLIFLISQIVAAIVPAIYVVQDFLKDDMVSIDKAMDLILNTPTNILIMSLYFTGISTLVVIIYCRFIEKRSLFSMGFNKEKALKEYFKGMIIGFIIFSLAVLIAYITGSLKFNGFNGFSSIGIIITFLGGFLVQGMCEEVTFRGYFFVSLTNKVPIIVAIIINSVFFSVLHMLNPGVSFLAVINIILFGAFASLYFIKTNSIWGVCAIHSVWNFVQGNFYGFQVSGLETENSLFSFTSLESGKLINGGTFGMEGGLGVTIVLIVAIIIVIISKRSENK